MKQKLVILLQFVIKKLAQFTIWKYRPAIVGVTGSVGKTSAKMAIAAVLQSERRVRVAPRNFNNEIGLPLVILSDESEIHGLWFWVRLIGNALWGLIFRMPYPEILVLEYGIDKPGDMKYLLEIARPNVAVITAIGEIPVHVEFFSGPQEVAREKARIIEQLPAGGFAILNHDNDIAMDLKGRTRAHLLTFGFSRNADLHVSGFQNRLEGERPAGVSFKLEYAGSFVPVRLDGVYGRTQAYAAAAAASVGVVFGMNLVKISEALRKNYEPPPHRLELLAGIKETLILDDAYNASPLSMFAALDTIKDLPGKRKIVILGDMLEIGQFAMEAHEDVGKEVKGTAQILITIGPRAKFIAEGAKSKGFNKKNIFSFDTAEEARSTVQEVLKKGDLVLVKGSRAMQLEKIIEEIRAF